MTAIEGSRRIQTWNKEATAYRQAVDGNSSLELNDHSCCRSSSSCYLTLCPKSTVGKKRDMRCASGSFDPLPTGHPSALVAFLCLCLLQRPASIAKVESALCAQNMVMRWGLT